MNAGLTAWIICAMTPQTYVCKMQVFVTYVTFNGFCCIHITHIKFATLLKLFNMKQKTNTGLHAGDNYGVICFWDMYLGEKRGEGCNFSGIKTEHGQ